MAEHLFLCGLSASQRAEFEGGEELHLHGHRRNVRLYLDDIRKHLLEVEPELLTDLAEIATYVFAADCAVSRGGPAFEGMGKDWRREFRLVIAVRQPALWREPQRLRALRDVIQFLSDETWSFEFVTLTDPPGIQAYLGIRTTDLERQGDSTVMLFSGGLDSFAGAVHELSTSNRHVVLVSRRVGGLTDKRQRELADDLKSSHPRRVTHIPVEVGLTEETAAVEHTQRTRSFLFAAIAMVAAVLEDSNRVRFYENGIMSVNLPIATQVVATRASRSTHPRSLLLCNGTSATVVAIRPRCSLPIWRHGWLAEFSSPATVTAPTSKRLKVRSVPISITRFCRRFTARQPKARSATARPSASVSRRTLSKGDRTQSTFQRVTSSARTSRCECTTAASPG